MKIKYFQDTDTPYIEFRPADDLETKGLDENTILDLGARGNICSITIEHASSRANIPHFSFEQAAAIASAAAIREAVELLANHPKTGHRVVAGELRELVISFGKTGYVALFRFLPAHEQIRILAIHLQRELDYHA